MTFFPTVNWAEGSVEVGTALQTADSNERGKRTQTTSVALYESLNVTADGYVYHPRFMLFHSRLWGGLNQQYVSGTSGNWHDSSSPLSYELKATVLPEHPYTLELFTMHAEPNTPFFIMRTVNSTYDLQGATFQYKNAPYFFNAGYTDSTTQSATYRTDAQTHRVNGSYAGSIMTDAAAFSHTEYSSVASAMPDDDVVSVCEKAAASVMMLPAYEPFTRCVCASVR